jgi:hypothetical protein
MTFEREAASVAAFFGTTPATGATVMGCGAGAGSTDRLRLEASSGEMVTASPSSCDESTIPVPLATSAASAAPRINRERSVADTDAGLVMERSAGVC